MIKVSGLSNNREKQSDTSLAWILFQNIYLVHQDINNKEEGYSYMHLKIMSEHEYSNKVNKELDESWDDTENNQPFLKKNNIPSYINDIKPRATQVWNCD